ncbi:MAG: hypothetical protein JWS12_248 [Candidatus Saccharibacteria bacterium]|nr:hypothetical protein [Candidatus Saccharibacteria bacterium]
MNEKVLIVFAANPKGGESTASRDAFYSDCYALNPSDMLRDDAAKTNKQLTTPADYRSYERELRHRNGTDALAQLVLQSVERSPTLLQGGIHNYADYLRYKAASPLIKTCVVAIWCPAEVRYKRTVEKDMPGVVPMSQAEFLEAEYPDYDSPNPCGYHDLRIMQQADFGVYSNCPRSNMLGQIKGIINFVCG